MHTSLLRTMKCFTLLPTVSCSASNSPSDAAETKSDIQLIRRDALPLYAEVPEYVEKSLEETANPTVLDAVRSFRKEGCKVVQASNAIVSRCEKFVNTGIAHSYGSYANAVEFLHEEKNVLPRLGAVTGGLLFGYIISFRKGFIKRSLYAFTCGTIAASICYPDDAKVYANKSLQSSKKYATIGYHFLNGVTKDLGGFELPAFPLKLLNSDTQVRIFGKNTLDVKSLHEKPPDSVMADRPRKMIKQIDQFT